MNDSEFDRVWNRVREIASNSYVSPGPVLTASFVHWQGADAYEAHGFNLVTIMVDTKSTNGRSQVGEFYETPGATGVCHFNPTIASLVSIT